MSVQRLSSSWLRQECRIIGKPLLLASPISCTPLALHPSKRPYGLWISMTLHLHECKITI